ncbi:hypothetical protein COK09_25560, partial [Bacillus cereus]
SDVVLPLYKETALGRTEEEAKSNLSRKMLYDQPDEAFNSILVKVYPYGNEDSEYKFIAEYKFW